MPIHQDKRNEIEHYLHKAAKKMRPGEELSLRAVMQESGYSWYLVREVAIDLGLWKKSGHWKTHARRGLSIRLDLYKRVVKAARQKRISPEQFAEEVIEASLSRAAEQRKRIARQRKKRGEQDDDGTNVPF